VTRVNVLCEDRTGGGLAAVLQSASNRRRAAEGKSRLSFAPPGTVLNNHKLIDKCAGYDLLRFRSQPRFDHVYYVVDAKQLWDVDAVGLVPPQPNEPAPEFLARAQKAAYGAMSSRARGARDDVQWAEISAGFHPCVLMWERESLILPVADALGLGVPELSSDEVRRADGWVDNRFKQHLKGKYNKATDGIRLLKRIAESNELTERVLRANASLLEIVTSMVELPDA